MGRLEPISHRSEPCACATRHAPSGRMRHGRGEILTRHRHDGAFAAVVLAGEYVEAGDTGRHRVEPGDVILHRPFERHLDRVSSAGAEVLVLPFDWMATEGALGKVADPDSIAALAERDTAQAQAMLAEQFAPRAERPDDWPDELAADLRANPDLALEAWARRRGLHPGSLSRGFTQVFGVAPAAYRLSARVLRALSDIRCSQSPLAEIAAATGFADQAHMSRAIRASTGSAPGVLRLREVAPSLG